MFGVFIDYDGHKLSVGRPLTLLLGLKYKHIVTLKRTYITLAAFWVLSSVTALCVFFFVSIELYCTVVWQRLICCLTLLASLLLLRMGCLWFVKDGFFVDTHLRKLS